MLRNVDEGKMMKKISDDSLASIEFNVSYKHNGIQHTDAYYGHRVNLWRDILPPRLIEEIRSKRSEDQVLLDVKPFWCDEPSKLMNVISTRFGNGNFQSFPGGRI